MIPPPPVIPSQSVTMVAAPPPRDVRRTATLPQLDPPPVRVLDLGLIRGKAGQPNTVVVPMEFPIERRQGELKPTITCPTFKCLSSAGVRGVGASAEVSIKIESRKSLEECDFFVTLESADGHKVEGKGRLIIDRPDPYVLGLQTICGGQSSAPCKCMEDIEETTTYRAFWEHKRKEFWLSSAKGTIQAHAAVFPFKVFFAPVDPRPLEQLLIVELPELDREIAVKVCGSTAGFHGQQWLRRKEMQKTGAYVLS